MCGAYADHGANHVPEHDGAPPYAPPLLALYPALRETGWAVFTDCGEPSRTGPALTASGVVGLKTRRMTKPPERIAHQLEALTAIAARWSPACVVRSEVSGMSWRLPGLEALGEALRGWATGLNLPLTGYSAREVRAAIAGQPNASKDALGYAVMLRLGLIGQSRATAEWEAIAVGCYHSVISGEK